MDKKSCETNGTKCLCKPTGASIKALGVLLGTEFPELPISLVRGREQASAAFLAAQLR